MTNSCFVLVLIFLRFLDLTYVRKFSEGSAGTSPSTILHVFGRFHSWHWGPRLWHHTPGRNEQVRDTQSSCMSLVVVIILSWISDRLRFLVKQVIQPGDRVIVFSNKPYCAYLHLLKLVNFLLGNGVPDYGTIFQDGTKKCEIRSLLVCLWDVVEVSSQEAQ